MKYLLIISAFLFVHCGGSKKTTMQDLVSKENKPKNNIETVTSNTENQQFLPSIVPYSETNAIYKKQVDSISRLFAMYPLKDSTENKFVGTINFSTRKPNFVIIHHTAQNSCEQTLKNFTVTHSQVSAHYVICRNGIVYHMLNDMLRAWHGGNSRWGTINDMNSGSIGMSSTIMVMNHLLLHKCKAY